MSHTIIEKVVVKEIFEQRVKKIEKLNNKIGGDFKWSYVSDSFMQELSYVVTYDNDDTLRKDYKEMKANVECIRVAFTGDIITKFDDYKIVAVVEKTPKSDERIVSKFIENDATDYSCQAMTCEHCGKKANRKSVIVLENTITNERKIVGRTCLKDFTGHKTADQTIAMCTMLANIDVCDKMDYYNNGVILLEPFLAEVAQSMIFDGYRPASVVNSTKEVAFRNYLAGNIPSIEAKSMALEAINYVKNMSLKDRKASSFNNNIFIIASTGLFNKKHTGIASYIIEYSNIAKQYRIIQENKLQAIKEQRSIEKQSSYVGTIGDRATFNLTYVRSISFDSQFGTSFMHFFVDESNNTIVWKGSTSINYFLSKEVVEIGEKITIIGKIVAHKEYKEIKQTLINRCKLVS